MTFCTKRFWLGFLLLGMCATLLAGCGADTSAANPTAVPALPTPSAAAGTAGGPLDPAPVYEGNLEVPTCKLIRGWAYDRSKPNDPIMVELYDGNQLLTNLTANIFRQDLLTAGKGNGKHVFRLAFPAALIDGKPHQIRALIPGTNSDLKGSPRTITCTR